jgi:hypothetical protein
MADTTGFEQLEAATRRKALAGTLQDRHPRVGVLVDRQPHIGDLTVRIG